MIKLKATEQKMKKQFGDNYMEKFPFNIGASVDLSYEVETLNEKAKKGIEDGDYVVVGEDVK